MPFAPAFAPDPAILALGAAFYDPVAAAAFPDHRLRFRNDRAAAEVGLETLTDAEWTRHFGRFEPLPGLPTPLALRYHGHQFRQYNPDLGDGRGFLFAQLRDARGRLLDLGTKGSGKTPWSRSGDGRLTLKGAVREALATEMLQALGVDTSRTLSIVETGEDLHRGDEPSPTRSAVLVRLSHGHIRYGSFQRLAFHQDAAGMARLVDYCLTHFVGPGAGVPAARLLAYCVAGAARLAASWHAAGFVHGVLNTDNMNVTGESFDYGPWRWLPRWDADFTAAYFDHGGLYAFGRQAEALHWNLYQLATALKLVAPVEDLIPALKAFPAAHEREYVAAMLARLGVASLGEHEDLALAQAFETAMATSGVQPDRAFFDWRGGGRRAASPADAAYDGAAFAGFATLAAGFTAADGAVAREYWDDADPCSMSIEEVEALWSAIATSDDWTSFHAKIAAVRRMGAALAPAIIVSC